jgi:hypothetical protein
MTSLDTAGSVSRVGVRHGSNTITTKQSSLATVATDVTAADVLAGAINVDAVQTLEGATGYSNPPARLQLPSAAAILAEVDRPFIDLGVRFSVLGFSAADRDVVLIPGAGMTAYSYASNTSNLRVPSKGAGEFLLVFSSVAAGTEAATLLTIGMDRFVNTESD